MPTERVPIGNLLSSGHEELAGASASCVNVAVDDTGTVRRRPGIQTYDAAPGSAFSANPVDGLHVTAGGKVFAMADRDLYFLNGGAATLSGTITGTKRVVFTDTEALLVLAGGEDIYKVRLDNNAFSVLGGSPPVSSHVLFHKARLLANDSDKDRSKFRFSGQASNTVFTGHEIWNTAGISGFSSAESRPDPIVALGTNATEVYAFGSSTVEVFGPDPVLTYALLTSRNYGCIAPYSVIPFDNEFVWMDEHRRIVRSDGRSVQPLSDPIGSVLKSFERVDDCFGYRVRSGPGDFLVFDFPDARATYALQAGGGWSQWQGHENGQLGRFLVRSHAHHPLTDQNLVGLETGNLGQLVDGVADDLGDPIVAFAESGFQDRGARKPKECHRLRVTLERGTAPVNTASPVAFLQWADRPGIWRNPLPLYLGASGQTNPVIPLESLGVYRQRNWRFVFSADVDMALVSIEEDFSFVEE